MAQKLLKEKLLGSAGTVSGTASVLGSWQVCHSVCLGIIALLSLVGITVAGMPLAFLTAVAVPLWIIAASILALTMIIYAYKKCISRNLILLNSGLIVAGVPFQAVQPYRAYLWILGGIMVLSAAVFFINSMISQKKQKNCLRCGHD